MATDEATKQFGNSLHEDWERKSSFEEICGLLDNAIERFGGESFEAEVNKDTTEIYMSITFEDIVLENYSDDMYKVFRFAKHIGFKDINDSVFRMDFVFDGIWSGIES